MLPLNSGERACSSARRRNLIASSAIAITVASPSPAEVDLAAAGIMGKLAMLFVAADACGVEPGPELRRAIAAAGERIQDKTGATRESLDEVERQLRTTKLDCDVVRASYRDRALEALTEAERYR